MPEVNLSVLKYDLWRRFLYMSSVYAQYVKENAEVLDIAATASTLTGNHWKNVICLSSAYFGQIQEIINILSHVAFPDLINRNELDLNPQSHVEMLELCVKIEEIVSGIVENEMRVNVGQIYSDIDNGDE